MWSPIVLCLFVGLTFASNPGWKNDATYVYKLKGYNFANLDDVSQQQSGIVFKANLKLQPQEGKLRALLEKPKYAEVHAELPESWDPENEVDWKELPLTGKPFEVKMKDGIITDLIVSKDVPNWEVNFYKGAMSQFQLDTKAINVEDNEINSLPEDGDGDDDAVFVTREETVSGEAETLYLIRPLPNHVLQRRFEEASYLEEKGSVIEVMKHRNFNDSKELPSYSYGNGKMQWGKPAGNTMGQFLVRESTSRAVLTGSLRKFTVQQSYTYNKIVVSPTLSDNDKGTVVSVVNATLDEVQSQNEKIEEVPQPVNVGNLVYSYSTNPFSKSSNPSQKRTSSSRKHQSRNDENDYRRNNVRDRRSLPDYSDEDDDDDSSEEDYTQDKPQLKEAPRSPLLPYTIGFEGMSIKQQINVAKQVKELAKEVGKRMQDAQRQHHENLLDNFHTMISLVRIMNYDEIQEVAKDLYTNKYESSDRAAWTAFRDAVAEAGTGPALLTVSDWITSRKMSGEEASQVVSTMTDSVRQPTEEYVKALFKLATSPEVQHQWPLNDTILLGCTDVIRRVYVDNEQSDDRYPTKSFGSFDTEEGERFVKQQVMSHLNKELSNAVRNDETHKIHVFIRAIGNTGAYAALRIFEPYLEGRQQMSQFQRVQIILSMDRIVENHPQTSRAVLYRTYQNPAEDTQVRMAAVYQLMRTAPPAEMLQAMAMYTNIDDDDYVNAVVVSSIETACDLEGWEFIELREAAESAKPLLNDEKTYGFSHGANYLRSYVSDELSKIYKKTVQVYGSDDSAYPKGLQYKVREFQGGIKRITHNLEAVLSSMDDLLKVLYEQTAQFQQEEKEQKEKSQEQEKNQWSSQNIAKLLNLKSEETEQLEAFLFMEYGSNYYMTALDNRTVEDLADIMREYEEDLKKEKQINTYKLSTDEMAISFPTASGLPFLFTHDIPMFVKVEGKVSAKADSPIFEHGKINTPDKINFKADVRFVYSTKVQSRLSFIAPFSHKQHFAGFDKHMETNMPLSVEGEVDLKEKNVEIEIEFDNDQETPIFHYATVPYTSKMEVTSFEPLLTSHNTKIIKQDDLQGYENTFGKKSTGMAFRVEMQHSRRFFTSLDLARIIKLGPKDAFQSLWDDNSIQYSHLNVNFSPEKSETNKAVIRLSYESKYRSQPDSDSDSEWILNENAEPAQRQEELMRKVAADIKNVQVNSVDACVEFKGQKKIKYIVTGAVAASKVDPKSRVMVSYKRKGNAEPQELHLVVKSYNPNTNALDVDYTLQNDPMTSNEIKIKFGGSESSLSKMDIQVEHRRSEERKHYLKQLPMYKQCKDEMRADNKQLPACVNMTQEANLLDRVDVKVRYENLDESLEDSIESAFNAITFFARAEVESNEKDGNENEIEMQARFHADLEAVNVTIKTQEQETTFFNVPIDDLTKEIVVSHPVFNLKSRLFSYMQELDTYTHFCTVDRNQVNTFSNNTYPTEISKHWTVMLQYLNGHSRKQHKSVEEQLRSQPENYVVLVRESPESSNKKEVKIVVSAPETDFELYEIDMSPSEGQTRGKVTVNDKQVKVSEKESEDIEDGYIQIYALPNGEIKVDIEDAFHAIYDGSRVRISTTDDKFRKRVVGICGQFTEQQDEDFLTPQANYAVDAEDFVRSLEVEGQNGKQMRESFRGRNDKTVEKELPLYVNVITNNDYDEGNNDKTTKNIGCTYFQTQYKEQGNEICFTLNPQPNCSSHCRPKKEMKKKVAVHCIKKSNVSNLWKKQIDNGSSPDFSNKSQDKSIYMSLPESCSP